MDNNDNRIALDDSQLDEVNGGTDVRDPVSKTDKLVAVKCDNPACGKKKTIMLSALSSPTKSKCECGGRFMAV